MKQHLAYIALCVIVGLAAWTLRGCLVPLPGEGPDTVYVETIVPDTIYVPATPRVVRIFQRDTVSVKDTVRVLVPQGFRLAGAIQEHPIRIRGDEVTLQFFDPEAVRWMEKVYYVRRARWAVWIDIGAGFDSDAFVSPRLNLRFDRAYAYTGYALRPDYNGVEFGLRYRLIGRNY